MSKRFIHSINYMRGICMLGVIGIHVGSVALTMPSPNLTLTAILEILSRFLYRPSFSFGFRYVLQPASGSPFFLW